MSSGAHMGRSVTTGNPPIEIFVRRSPRTRRMTLRVSRLDGKVTLSVPNHISDRRAEDFAAQREAWLRSALSEVPGSVDVDIGARLPFEDREISIEPANGRRSQLIDNRLEVPPDRAGPSVKAVLKEVARDRLANASDRHAAKLGRTYTGLSLRDTRSRWGSCTAEGRLMYSWRLIMAPAHVLDYVAAHEVAHLERMDHSSEFWSVVERLCPEYREPRRWLRENGPGLHRYIFAN